MENLGLIPGLGIFPGGGHGNLPQYSCLENPHGQRSLVDYIPWGCKELDVTRHTHTHTHILRLSVEAKHCRNLKKIASIQSSKFNTMWHGKKKSPFSICLIQYCQTFLPWVINVFISQLQSKKLDDKDFTLFIFMSSIPGIEDIKLSQWFWLRKQTHWLPCWLSR